MNRYLISIIVAICSIISSVQAISYVDLGLPSGKLWATENIGVEVSKYNAYYGWGEILPNKGNNSAVAEFSWRTYMSEQKKQHVYLMDPSKINRVLAVDGFYLNPPYNQYTLRFSGNFYADGCGRLDDPLYCVVADKTNAKLHESRRLPLSYDAANAVDKDYEIPSQKDFQELFDNTTMQFKQVNGFNHYVFTSKKNGKSIAFPASGKYLEVGNGPHEVSKNGYYWTSDAYSNDPKKAICAKLSYTEVTRSGSRVKDKVVNTTLVQDDRYHGFSIRPIKRVAPVVRANDLSIGLGEPTVELTGIMASPYANSNFVSEVSRTFGIEAYRIWVNFAEFYKKVPNNVYGKYQTDSYGDPIINEQYFNEIKTLVNNLKKSGVKKIAIVPTTFAAEKSPYIYTYNASANKFCWIKVSEVQNYPNRQDLIWGQNIPAPGDAGYEKFMEDQEWAYYDLAWELKGISGVEFYFEGPNELDGGIIMNKKVAGDKFTLLGGLYNTKELFDKYSKKVTDVESLGFNTEFVSPKVKAKFLVDLSYRITKGVKGANRNFKVLSPSFTTLGCTFITLRDMYEEIAKMPLKSDKDPNKYFEILNIHPYIADLCLGDASCGCKNKSDWKSHMMELQRVCLDNGHNVPVWITEVGANSNFTTNDQERADQLRFQLDNLKYDNDLRFVETVIVFRMIDWLDGNGVPDGFGIFRNLFQSSNLINPALPEPQRYATSNMINKYPLKAEGEMLYFYLHKDAAPMDPEITYTENTVSESSLEVYPNPSNGMVYVACDDSQTLQRITVKDAMGRVVLVEETDGNLFNLNLTPLKRGVCFVEVETNKVNTVKKIILK